MKMFIEYRWPDPSSRSEFGEIIKHHETFYEIITEYGLRNWVTKHEVVSVLTYEEYLTRKAIIALE